VTKEAMDILKPNRLAWSVNWRRCERTKTRTRARTRRISL